MLTSLSFTKVQVQDDSNGFCCMGGGGLRGPSVRVQGQTPWMANVLAKPLENLIGSPCFPGAEQLICRVAPPSPFFLRLPSPTKLELYASEPFEKPLCPLAENHRGCILRECNPWDCVAHLLSQARPIQKQRELQKGLGNCPGGEKAPRPD